MKDFHQIWCNWLFQHLSSIRKHIIGKLKASDKGFKAVIECYEIPMNGRSVENLFLGVFSHGREIEGFEKGNFGSMYKTDRKCMICVNRGYSRNWIIVRMGIRC
jgi:hypothetical protein